MVIYTILFWAIIYNIMGALSILYLGYVSRFFGQINLSNLLSVVLNQYFIIGAILAFASRLIFAVIDTTIAKNGFADSSTSITFLISLSTIISVLIINNVYLQEKLSSIQIIGVVVMFIGLAMVGIK